VVLFCACADVSIVGMNMSLMMNTVGFYQVRSRGEALHPRRSRPWLTTNVRRRRRRRAQISKLCTIPVICVIDYVWFYKRFHEKVMVSTAVVLLGVAVATVSDVGLNGAGLAVAALAVLATAGQQVLIGALQKTHSITANDLVGQTAPIQAASMLLMGPLVDYLVVGEYVWTYQWHVPSLVAILLSCALAAAVNMSQYFCIGRFSAISFQVLPCTPVLNRRLGVSGSESDLLQLCFLYEAACVAKPRLCLPRCWDTAKPSACWRWASCCSARPSRCATSAGARLLSVCQHPKLLLSAGVSNCVGGDPHRMSLAVLGMVGYGVFSVAHPATVDPPPQLPMVTSPPTNR
jgi:hypothetical protein